MLELAWP